MGDGAALRYVDPDRAIDAQGHKARRLGSISAKRPPLTSAALSLSVLTGLRRASLSSLAQHPLDHLLQFFVTDFALRVGRHRHRTVCTAAAFAHPLPPGRPPTFFPFF